MPSFKPKLNSGNNFTQIIWFSVVLIIYSVAKIVLGVNLVIVKSEYFVSVLTKETENNILTTKK